MAEWVFKCYVDKGKDVIRESYEDSNEEVQATFLSKLSILRTMPRGEWREPPYKDLRGEGKGLGEIRFKAEKLQHRPLGFHMSNDNVFVILIWATKKGKKWKPKNAIAIAQRRKQEVLQDGGETTLLDWLHFH